MTDIRKYSPVEPGHLIKPVEAPAPSSGNKKFTEGEPHPQPEQIKLREGERKQIWVPAGGSAYGRDGKLEGEWKNLTKEEAEELGLKWE